VVKLSDDYLSFTDTYQRIDAAFWREAPAIVHKGEYYYIVTSGLTSWATNQAQAFRTKHLLEKYWDGKITGYLFEGVKEHIDKRKAEKQSYIKEHMKDEIVPMEREIRAEVREWLEPLTAQANQYDLDIKAEYFYVTEDFEELKYRPKEKYTYTLVAEIAHFGETNEDRIVVVSVDLLFVRIGKKAYLGVKNKHAKKELEDIISEVLSEINKNGIEAYCQDV
jgi:hypothetical protein